MSRARSSCAHVPEQLLPKMDFRRVLGSAFFGTGEEPAATPEHPHILFSGRIDFPTECFDPEHVMVSGTCKPPRPFFEIETPKA